MLFDEEMPNQGSHEAANIDIKVDDDAADAKDQAMASGEMMNSLRKSKTTSIKEIDAYNSVQNLDQSLAR